MLAQIGIVPDDIRSADIDETPLSSDTPRDCAVRLARAKAVAINAGPGAIVLAADTVVAVGRRMLGKPADTDEAASFLQLLSGRRHRVITGVATSVDGKLRSRAVETIVRFRVISKSEIKAYVATGEWNGKAGGYAIQGWAAAFVPWIAGSHAAVVGLPLVETLNLLEAAGYRRAQR